MTKGWRFRSGGLTIDADRPLPGLALSDDAAADELRLRVGDRRTIPLDPPDGERIVDPGERYKRLYFAVRDDDGYLLRFFGQCDVHLTKDLTSATYHRDPGADDGLVDVLIAGTFLALVLSLRGTCVLHASAVEVNGRALAFVGYSGMGKSTLTIASCAAGARLIAEDVLAVETEAHPTCLPGNTDIRLRKGSVSLIERVPDAERVATADGRHAVRPALTKLTAIPLDTLVIPLPDRNADELTVKTLPATSALFRLLNFPRVIGLCEPAVVRRQFEGAGAIARAVPVRAATVPWGPPFRDDLGERLLELMT